MAVILIAYDGSEDAQFAIDQAGELLSGEPATVVTVWESTIEVMARTGAGLGMSYGGTGIDFEELDKASENSARRRADEGVARARLAGLDAQPSAVLRDMTIAATLLSEADRVQARAIVMGTRGLTGIKSMLLGSVSHAVLQHADRTVIIVPSPAIASERAARRTIL